MNIIHQPHDKFFKKSMADKRFATEFFENYLPAEVLQRIDLKTLKLEKDTFIDKAYQENEADVIYSVNFGETRGYLYILCEHQSKIDDQMAFRLAVYVMRILDLHRKQNPNAPLPIVYPIVVYTGEAPWTAPTDFFDLFGEQKEFAKEIMFKPFQLIDAHNLEDDDLQKQLWSGIVLFAFKHRQVRNFAKFLDTLIPWLINIEQHRGADFAKNVIYYVFNEMNSDNNELFVKKTKEHLTAKPRSEGMITLAQAFFNEGEEKGIRQGMQRGVHQGRQEGIQQGEKTILLRQLQRKFGDLPNYYQQRINQADSSQLLQWADSILQARALAEVFEE